MLAVSRITARVAATVALSILFFGLFAACVADGDNGRQSVDLGLVMMPDMGAEPDTDGDDAPPHALIIAPMDGETVTGQVTLVLEIDPPLEPGDTIHLIVDDEPVDATLPMVWDSTSVADGPHRLLVLVKRGPLIVCFDAVDVISDNDEAVEPATETDAQASDPTTDEGDGPDAPDGEDDTAPGGTSTDDAPETEGTPGTRPEDPVDLELSSPEEMSVVCGLVPLVFDVPPGLPDDVVWILDVDGEFDEVTPPVVWDSRQYADGLHQIVVVALGEDAIYAGVFVSLVSSNDGHMPGQPCPDPTTANGGGPGESDDGSGGSEPPPDRPPGPVGCLPPPAVAPTCGDCQCDIEQGETLDSCPHDCGYACGNGESEACDFVLTERFLANRCDGSDCRIDICRCTAPDGSSYTGAGCGDGCCTGHLCGETPQTCPNDCRAPCGNQICEPGEGPDNCAEDCVNHACGNGRCEPPFESEDSCAADCEPRAVCGDCVCSDGEDLSNCPQDCGYCGDGVCAPCVGESSSSCFVDCFCGDGACEAGEREACSADCHCGDGVCQPEHLEDSTSCAVDCHCGDGLCAASVGETPETCAADCHCGDGTCDPPVGETPGNCPTDCLCGNGTCEPERGESPAVCPDDCTCGDGRCDVERGETSQGCPTDCLCGDGVCHPTDEDATTCGRDCPCGNGFCEPSKGESPTTCADDCGCGDGLCAPLFGESAGRCPADCGCGNGTCDTVVGESADRCPEDCRCGDGVCDEAGGETSATCRADCCRCGDCVCDAACGESASSCPLDCGGCSDGTADSCDVVLTLRYLSGDPRGRDCRHDVCACAQDHNGLVGSGCGDGCCAGFVCGETPESCPDDCGTACGDGACVAGESPASCPEDCFEATCGNGRCERPDEDSASCPDDCGSICGNCVCDPEEMRRGDCAVDCGRCGDSVCSACLGETATTCVDDCAF